MATRIGVDVGGTFTDLIFYDDESGEVRVGKVPTTPAAPERGRARRRRRPRRHDASSSTRRSTSCTGRRSGSTRSSRARGAVVGLLATRGLPRRPRGAPRRPRTIRTTSSGRCRRRSCRAACGCRSRERMRADGTVHAPLERGRRPRGGRAPSRRRASSASRSRSSTPTPTRRTSSRPSRRCATAGFEGEISLSHRVSGEYREYERTYDDGHRRVRPRRAWRRTCGRLDERLGGAGFDGEPARDALRRRRDDVRARRRTRPFETILSGPGRRRRGRGRAGPRARARRRDHRRRRRHELRHLPDHATAGRR